MLTRRWDRRSTRSTTSERFLDESPYAPKQSRDEAERIIGEIRPRLSYIEIGTDDVGSHVSIGGTRSASLAPLPRPLAVAPGAHEVRREKTDMRSESRSVSPVPGQKLRMFVKLRSVADVHPAAATPHPLVAADPAPPSPRSDVVTPVRLREADDIPPATDGRGAGRRAIKWVAWSAALAGAGVGIYGTLHNSSLVNDFDAGCGLSRGAVITDGSGRKTQSQCQDLKTQYESAGRLGLIGFIGAGALAAAGFVFWATEPSATTSRVALASCVPAVGGALGPSVVCALRF